MRYKLMVMGFAILLAGCGSFEEYFPNFLGTGGDDMGTVSSSRAASSRTLNPDTLSACRGHVLIPAVGMIFVRRGASAPSTGRYLTEASVTPPYRILFPGLPGTQDYSPSRLNIVLDTDNRITDLRCG